jgi:uncharacterized protein YuzE
MRAEYDPEVDILMITFREGGIADSDLVGPGVVFDYDADGNVVRIELLDASKRTANAREMQFAVAGA